MAKQEIEPRSDAGLLFGLLKERVPLWASLCDEELHLALRKLADSGAGDGAAVQEIMATRARLRAADQAEAEAEARFAAYHTDLAAARRAASHYVTAARDRMHLAYRQAQAQGVYRARQESAVAIISQHLDRWKGHIEAGWPVLKPEEHPDRIAVTARERFDAATQATACALAAHEAEEQALRARGGLHA